MRYEPYEDEYIATQTMTDEELLEYFMYRIVEMDEVWGLKDGSQWATGLVEGQETQPFWPYKRYADDAKAGEWQGYKAVPESLECFIYQTLNKLAKQAVLVEIMPRKSAAGCLISPQRLFNFLESMKESRDFVLDD